MKSRFFACIPSPHSSPHYHPGGVYIGWVEMWEVDSAIELTMVDEFYLASGAIQLRKLEWSLLKLWMVLLKLFLGVPE